MKLSKRRIGLEQEFFLVDEAGMFSNRADEFLQNCRQEAEAIGLNPDYFMPEWVKGIIEINTPPAHTPTELATAYIKNLQLVLQVGQKMHLRLYPLSSYPLHLIPVIRDKLSYHVQVRTVGYDRFLNAGKCTGTHLHLEVPPGVIDSRVGVSYNSSAAEREELINIYNLATALDSALIALGRACPFYEGEATGLAYHIVRYRGSDRFGWEGVYTNLQSVGGLMPYADSVERLVELQFERYYAWLAAMDQAGVERNLFTEGGGNLLKAGWNPVRLNALGTVELRGIDSNYPDVILTIIRLVYNAARRVRQEGIIVRPAQGVHTFELRGDWLFVPDFDYLNGELLFAAVTEGVKSSKVTAYLDSILEFAIQDGSEGINYLEKLKSDWGEYQTTEAEILQQFAPAGAQLEKEEGLRLVREACDELEAQVASFSQKYSV
ncbi:MAG: glutamate-cysteine ligase family protein [Coleofasciculus sp. G1-WW12-02]|uniref:glutamate-cysteine ligase family protein n=1 Tax=unclassified Coleofasciculus TaxID=2692782 RepID=UPI0032FB4F66